MAAHELQAKRTAVSEGATMQHPVYGFPRIPLPRTPVNKLLVNAPQTGRWHYDTAGAVNMPGGAKHVSGVYDPDHSAATQLGILHRATPSTEGLPITQLLPPSPSARSMRSGRSDG